MVWISNNVPLIIRDVRDDDVEVNKYADKCWIIKIENKEYLMINRKFSNNSKKYFNDCIELPNAKIEINSNFKKKNLYYEYGDDNSIIVDMNGIDNFRFAKSEIFNDYIIRKIVKKWGY